MTRVLVTGADGFTGRHLCAKLADHGFEVHGVVRRAPTTPVQGSVALYEADLLDATAVRAVVAQVRPELAVHLAAIAFVAHGDVDAMYRVNVVGTRNLLAALAAGDAPPRSVLVASSANVYGNATAGVIDEACPVAPANDYAVSKLAMENMTALWRSSLPLTLVRPFNYIGRGQSSDFVVAKIADHVLRRERAIELGNIDVERDFSDVRTVVDAYRRLLELESPPAGPLNVCSGQATRLRDIVEVLCEIGRHRLDVRVNPAFVRAQEVQRLVGSSAALERCIGALQKRTLRETLSWILAPDGTT